MNVIQRVKAPTPKFFRVLRNIGLTLTAASAAVLTAPVALPALVLTVAGYMAVAGAVMSTVSQTAIEPEPDASLTGETNGGGTSSVGKL
jgi:hypothetical protein